MNKDFILYTVKNQKLNITTYGYENRNTAPCIIYVHGFKGFKDWGFVPYTGEYLASIGYFVITFNFSHNGVGDSLTEFTQLDKFAENTFSMEIDELSEIIEGYQFGFFDNDAVNKIGLIGHSRGGAISLIASRKTKAVDAIALWASVSNLDRYSERQKEKWKKEGVFEVLNTRTKQVMKLNVTLLEDIEKHKDKKLSLEKALKYFKKPLLIAHGDQDLAVPVSEANQLYKWSHKKLTKMLKIPAAGHTFGAVHPFEGSNPKLEQLLETTELFLRKNLIEE
ncbi:MAG: prolyl oligopeptidase family serine peptidase [Bacteroidota bacterium]|nr:prolyl oligopeptidase family serine peptidase [Bacteroidota bacterium]